MDNIAEQLKMLRLPGMAHCWQALQETRKMDSLSLNDGLQILLQAEVDNRKERRNERLIKEARFRYQARLEDMSFDTARGLNQSQIMTLATCEYMKRGVPVIITGAAGTGKSWLATALGYQACINGFHVAYYNVYKLFEMINLYRIEGRVHKFFDKMVQMDLLIIDDFGVKVLDKQQILDFMELMEDRHGAKSTIIASQLPVSEWYDVLHGNTTAADAILDRLVHTAIRFDLKGDSLRKESGKNNANKDA